IALGFLISVRINYRICQIDRMVVVFAKKIDWLTVDLYVPVMLMDYSLMNSGSYTCNKSEGLISLSNLKNSFCSSFIRIDFTIYQSIIVSGSGCFAGTAFSTWQGSAN
ncbi:MAG: hypothetical protein L0I00_12200, partial [Lactiplantibacillus plantarum]|nr:hypothetical protein [Lactiplantibacillus plantarum]